MEFSFLPQTRQRNCRSIFFLLPAEHIKSIHVAISFCFGYWIYSVRYDYLEGYLETELQIIAFFASKSWLTLDTKEHI